MVEPHWTCPACGQPCFCRGTDESAHRTCGVGVTTEPITGYSYPVAVVWDEGTATAFRAAGSE